MGLRRPLFGRCRMQFVFSFLASLTVARVEPWTQTTNTERSATGCQRRLLRAATEELRLAHWSYCMTICFASNSLAFVFVFWRDFAEDAFPQSSSAQGSAHKDTDPVVTLIRLAQAKLYACPRMGNSSCGTLGLCDRRLRRVLVAKTVGSRRRSFGLLHASGLDDENSHRLRCRCRQSPLAELPLNEPILGRRTMCAGHQLFRSCSDQCRLTRNDCSIPMRSSATLVDSQIRAS
jgi:hypothetical protein